MLAYKQSIAEKRNSYQINPMHHLPKPLSKVAIATTILILSLSGQLFAVSPEAAKHGNKGNELAQQGKYDEAIKEFTLAINENVKDPRFYLDRGRTYRIANKMPEAMADFSKAIEMAPDNDVGYFERGKTELAQNQYDPALTDLNKAIELNPNNVDAYYRRGLTEYHQRKFDEAIKDYTTSIEKNPTDLNAYNRRADVYVAMGNYKQAQPDLETALKLKPDDPATLQRLQFVKNKIAQAALPPPTPPTPTPTPSVIDAFALTPLNILYGAIILVIIIVAILFWARSRARYTPGDEE
ncbi:MAG: tetratricopeptide repeat protein [Chthoniobacterales bacterium]